MMMVTVSPFHQEAFPESQTCTCLPSLQAEPSLRATLSAGPLGLRAVLQELCDHLQPHCPPPRPEPWTMGPRDLGQFFV